MKDFFLEETNLEQEFNSETDVPCDVYRDQHGNFHVFNGSELEQVKPSVQIALAKKYHEYKRLKKAIEDGKDIEALKTAHQDRLKLKQQMSIETAEQEQTKAVKAELYKHAEEDAEKREKRKKRAEEAAFINSEDCDAGMQEIINQLDDFVSNQIREEEQVHRELSYEEPDPYETIDPDIFTQGYTYTHHKQDEEPEEKEKPLVLFYFDRSGSFDPKGYPKKTELGKRLQALFETNEDLDVDTIYFSDGFYPESQYSNAEERALWEGGNNTPGLLNDISERTKGRLANVVILTDADQGGGINVPINGSIWFIFAESWDPGLVKSIVKATPETKKKVFYFEQIR